MSRKYKPRLKKHQQIATAEDEAFFATLIGGEDYTAQELKQSYDRMYGTDVSITRLSILARQHPNMKRAKYASIYRVQGQKVNTYENEQRHNNRKAVDQRLDEE